MPGANAGDGDENLEARGKVRLADQAGFQLGVDRGDLALDLSQSLRGMPLQER